MRNRSSNAWCAPPIASAAKFQKFGSQMRMDWSTWQIPASGCRWKVLNNAVVPLRLWLSRTRLRGAVSFAIASEPAHHVEHHVEGRAEHLIDMPPRAPTDAALAVVERLEGGLQETDLVFQALQPVHAVMFFELEPDTLEILDDARRCERELIEVGDDMSSLGSKDG